MEFLDYLPASLSFFIGLFAGFQGIYERYYQDSLRACKTLPGVIYLLSRGLVPGLLFISAHSYNLIETHLWLWAAGIGSGSEAVLRSQFYIRQEQAQPGQMLELVRGPLDLLRWYQNLFLQSAANQLAKARRDFVEKHLPDVLFPDLCERILTNKDAWTTPDITEKLEEAVVELREAFQQKGDDSPRIQRKYNMKLGYRIREIVGEKGFLTLLGEESTPERPGTDNNPTD